MRTRLTPAALDVLAFALLLCAPAAWAGFQIVLREHNGAAVVEHRCNALTPSTPLQPTSTSLTLDCVSERIFQGNFQ